MQLEELYDLRSPCRSQFVLTIREFLNSNRNVQFCFKRNRTFVLIISAHPYCARKCTPHVIHERGPAAEGPPSGAPYSSCRGKIKETQELIFSWLSWLAVLLVGAYARRRRRRRRSCPTWRPHSKKETYSLSLPCTSLILDIPVMIN